MFRLPASVLSAPVAALLATACSYTAGDLRPEDEVVGDCTNGETRSCGIDRAPCQAGTQLCVAGEWADCDGMIPPTLEVCDGVDNDCNGEVDEGLSVRLAAIRGGPCSENREICAGAVGWQPHPDNPYLPEPESCDDADNDCVEGIDNGCDDDGDDFCDASYDLVGTPLVCPNGGGDCDDDSEYGPTTFPGAAEACNGRSDDCDPEIDEGLTTRATANAFGRCALNTESCDADLARWVANAGNLEPLPESCNDADDDCDGEADNGCDDDLDGYCDAAYAVEGNPLVCANGGGDCDDDFYAAHPGFAEEICADGHDNDCDGRTDGEDQETCAPLVVTISPELKPTGVTHGASVTLWATLSPPTPAERAPRTWSVIDVIPSDCDASGLETLGEWGDDRTTYLSAFETNDPANRGCDYVVEVAVDGHTLATDTTVVSIRSQPPLVELRDGVFDGDRWTVVARPNVPFSLYAEIWDPDFEWIFDTDWAGNDVGLLTCAPDCYAESFGVAEAFFTSTPVEGELYEVTLSVSDRYEDPVLTAIEVVTQDCVWVAPGGTGAATGDSPSAALDSIQAGLDLAALDPTADLDVCVIGWASPCWSDGDCGGGTCNGDGVCVYREDLVMPTAPAAGGDEGPDLLGGFDAQGARNWDRPVVELAAPDGLYIGDGYVGTIRGFDFQQLDVGLAFSSVITIEGASPRLEDCAVSLAPIAGARGITVRSASNNASSHTAIAGGYVTGFGPGLSDAIGLGVQRLAGADELSVSASDWFGVSLWSCAGICQGVVVEGGASLAMTEVGSIFIDALDQAQAVVANGGSEVAIDGASEIYALAGTGAAVAVDLQTAGQALPWTTATVKNVPWIHAASEGPVAAIAIRLSRTQNVSILDNGSISAGSVGPGGEFTIGIADGLIARDGTLGLGSSTGLRIEGNDTIAGGYATVEAAGACEGPAVAAGILLVGSSDVTIRGNGRPNDVWNGIRGGTSTQHWSPAERRVPPSAVGLWMVQTTNVDLLANEIRGGDLQDLRDSGLPCSVPPVPPAPVGLRLGVPPNLAYASLDDDFDTAGTYVAGNGITCGPPDTSGLAGAGPSLWCAAVEVSREATAGNADGPILANNYLAAGHVPFGIALRQRGGDGLLVVNNTLEADFLPDPFSTDLPAPSSLRKWPVLLEQIAPGGIGLVNNIIYARQDAEDLVEERLAIKEVLGPFQSHSNIGSLVNNLLRIDGAVEGGDAVYIQTVNAANFPITTSAVESYTETQINDLIGSGAFAGNFVGDPAFVFYDELWLKSLTRLRTTSDAIDAGIDDSIVPAVDIEGDVRPCGGAAVDVGHDELCP